MASLKIVVLGDSGFIGGNVVRHFRSRRAIVTGLSSSNGDLLSKSGLDALKTVCDEETTLVFCAGLSPRHGDTKIRMEANAEMAYNVARTVAKTGLRGIVYLSSVDVYGLPPAALPIMESTAVCPDSYYGLSKLNAETVLRIELDRPVTILRLPGVFGEGDKGRSIIGRIALQIRDGVEVELQKDGRIKRDFIDVNFLLRAIERFIRLPHDGILNVVTGNAKFMRTYVEAIGLALEKRVRCTDGNDDDGRGYHLIFDASKLRAFVPAIMNFDLEAALSGYFGTLLPQPAEV